jgi:hypothetical protein
MERFQFALFRRSNPSFFQSAIFPFFDEEGHAFILAFVGCLYDIGDETLRLLWRIALLELLDGTPEQLLAAQIQKKAS